MLINRKWASFGTSIFTKVTQQANKFDAINLAQGFPDFDGPAEIIEAAWSAMKASKNQYAPSAGIPELRECLAAKQKQSSSVSYDATSEVTVVSGATEGIYCSLVSLLKPGQEVIAFAPFYDSYPAAASAAGARLRTVPLRGPDWVFSKEELKAAVTENTSMILLNTPHNPTGKVFNREELSFIAELAIKNDLIVVTDEVYEKLVFDGVQHHFMASLPGMRDRTVTISSTSKTFSMTGWKIGYVFASPELTEQIRCLHQFTVFCSATPLQYGMVAALNLSDEYYETLRSEYQDKRDLLVSVLQEAGFQCKKPQGTYFVVGDFRELSQKSDQDFSQELIESHQVAAIPLSPFYEDSISQEKLLRFAFCKDKATINMAAEKLKNLRR